MAIPVCALLTRRAQTGISRAAAGGQPGRGLCCARGPRACLLPSRTWPAPRRRRGQGSVDSRRYFRLVIFAWASRRGPPRREEMIMTQNKAQKTAIRRRMAETGESYVVARRAVLGDGATPEAPGTPEGLAPPDQLTPEEQYALEAAAEGASTAEIDA